MDDPYRVIHAIRNLRRELGLTPNDLVTLQALISFMPRKSRRAPDPMTIVFPSNASLSERTNGLDERTIRRCLSRLANSGLIQRRDSATRKRFPLRFGGVIRDAFGFDLAPMYRRENQLQAWSKAIEEQAEQLRSLRAQALAMRVEAQKLKLDEDAIEFLAEIRRALRRTTVTQKDVLEIIRRLNDLIGKHPREHQFPAGNQNIETPKTDETSGTNGQNVRQVEAKRLKKIDRNTSTTAASYTTRPKPDPSMMSWADFKNLSAFYPNEPRDSQSILRIIDDVGVLLKVNRDRLLCHLQTKGTARLLVALDTIIGRAAKIRHPSSYLDKLMECST